ncbi:hypothetical protein EON63_22620, partial [archaeon]
MCMICFRTHMHSHAHTRTYTHTLFLSSAYTFFQKEIYAHNNKLVSLRDISVLEHEMSSLQRRIFEVSSQKQNMKTEYLHKIQNYMEDIFHVVSSCASYREEVTRLVPYTIHHTLYTIYHIPYTIHYKQQAGRLEGGVCGGTR